MNYWEGLLREDAARLTSLPYFKPAYMSLDEVHPIYSSAGGSSDQVAKAIIQATMLSGR